MKTTNEALGLLITLAATCVATTIYAQQIEDDGSAEKKPSRTYDKKIELDEVPFDVPSPHRIPENQEPQRRSMLEMGSGRMESTPLNVLDFYVAPAATDVRKARQDNWILQDLTDGPEKEEATPTGWGWLADEVANRQSTSRSDGEQGVDKTDAPEEGRDETPAGGLLLNTYYEPVVDRIIGTENDYGNMGMFSKVDNGQDEQDREHLPDRGEQANGSALRWFDSDRADEKRESRSRFGRDQMEEARRIVGEKGDETRSRTESLLAEVRIPLREAQQSAWQSMIKAEDGNDQDPSEPRVDLFTRPETPRFNVPDMNRFTADVVSPFGTRAEESPMYYTPYGELPLVSGSSDLGAFEATPIGNVGPASFHADRWAPSTPKSMDAPLSRGDAFDSFSPSSDASSDTLIDIQGLEDSQLKSLPWD